MKPKIVLLLLSTAALLAACQPYPKTPGGLVKLYQAHPHTPGVHIDKFTVNRPMRSVVAFVKRKADQCLNVKIISREKNETGAVMTSTAIVHPHTTLSARKGEIYVRETWSKDDSVFMVVADYFPLSHSKTRVELYYAWGSDFEKVAHAFTLWSKGEHVGCPDLS